MKRNANKLRYSNSDKLIYSLTLELINTFISKSHLFLTSLFNVKYSATLQLQHKDYLLTQ